MSDRVFKRLKGTRTRDGVFEGLVEYDDGTEEWRTPSSASVEIVNDRTGEQVEVSNIEIGGRPCE